MESRESRLKYWKRKKRPRDGQSNAKSCYCLSDHFHRSGLEGRVCDELRLRKIAGDLKDYRREVRLPLALDGCKLGVYICDFVVEENDGTIEYLEAKGIAFQRWKRNWDILMHMHKDDPKYKFRVVRK